MWLVHYKPHIGHELMEGKDSSRALAGFLPDPSLEAREGSPWR